MRWLVRIIGVLVSLAVVAVGALFLLPADRVAALAARQFETATGRALTIEGAVRPSIWPMIGARVDRVALANMPGSGTGSMIEAEAIDLGLDLAALIRGDLVVRRFELVSPRILLERDAQGRANWEFAPPAAAPGAAAGAEAVPATPGTPRVLSLERIEIRDGEFVYIDHGTGTDLRLSAINATLTMPDFAGPGQLDMAGRLGAQDFDARLGIGGVSGFLDGQVTTLSARLQAGGTTLGFEGRAGFEPLAAEGRLTLEGGGIAPLLALAGPAGPEPLPAGFRPVSLAGQVTLAPAGSLHLREASLGLGPNRLAMALDLALDGPRPRLTGEITAPSLDLRALTASESGAAAAAPASGAAEGWSRDPIDASALGLLDAAVSVTTGPVQAGVLDLESLRAVLTIDRARGVVEIREARLFQGSAAGELVANNRSGLSVGGNLRLADVALLPLLRQFAGFERLTGTGDLDLRFLGVGQSMAAIMRSLSGQGRIELGQGEIIGFDLAGMLRNLDMSYMGEGNRTIYDSLTGSFAIEGGVLRNEDLELASSAVGVRGRGLVDLGGQTLEYRLIPETLRNPQTGEALRVPLLITGPWSAPRYRLDLEGVAEERLREEAARLEERAREEIQRIEAEARSRVEQEIQQRLGGESLEGQESPGTTLEQELGRGLMRLLGGGGSTP